MGPEYSEQKAFMESTQDLRKQVRAVKLLHVQFAQANNYEWFSSLKYEKFPRRELSGECLL